MKLCIGSSQRHRTLASCHRLLIIHFAIIIALLLVAPPVQGSDSDLVDKLRHPDYFGIDPADASERGLLEYVHSDPKEIEALLLLVDLGREVDSFWNDRPNQLFYDKEFVAQVEKAKKIVDKIQEIADWLGYTLSPIGTLTLAVVKSQLEAGVEILRAGLQTLSEGGYRWPLQVYVNEYRLKGLDAEPAFNEIWNDDALRQRLTIVMNAQNALKPLTDDEIKIAALPVLYTISIECH